MPNLTPTGGMPLVALLTLLLTGCWGGNKTLPNPFNTADRVPPPMMRAPAPGTALPYYPAGSQPALPAPAFGSPAPGVAPGPGPLPTTNPYQPQAPAYQQQPYQPQPLGAAPRGPSASLAAASPGDTISVPTDGTTLRFGAPRSLAPRTTVASVVPRPAIASGWASGAAPVRTTVASTTTLPPSRAPRVRVPGSVGLERRPIDVAALQPRPLAPQTARITPLPSVDRSETVGWR